MNTWTGKQKGIGRESARGNINQQFRECRGNIETSPKDVVFYIARLPVQQHVNPGIDKSPFTIVPDLASFY